MSDYDLREVQGVPRRASESDINTEDVYLEAARHFLDVQISTHNLLDNKNAQVFSVGSVVLPVTFALLNLSARGIPSAAERALSAALGCYVLMLLFALFASFVRGLEYRPHIPTLKRHSHGYQGAALKRWVADEYERSITANETAIVRKARLVGAATLALYLEALSLSVAAIATLLL